jgi:hypothetical protein
MHRWLESVCFFEGRRPRLDQNTSPGRSHQLGLVLGRGLKSAGIEFVIPSCRSVVVIPNDLDQEDGNCSPLPEGGELLAAGGEPHREPDSTRRESDTLHRISGLQNHQGRSQTRGRRRIRRLLRALKANAGYLGSQASKRPVLLWARVILMSS